MKLSTILLVFVVSLSLLLVPHATFEAAGVGQQALQTSTLPYTWTVSRGPAGSNTIPLGPQYVSYNFYPNGTLSYNGFTVKPLSAKWGSMIANLTLPFTSLSYNSTVVEYVLNVTILGNSLSLVTSYRQIAGTTNLLVSYSGTLSTAGFVSEHFAGAGRKQLQNQTLTWGRAGYDWSDSKAQSPVFDNATNTVTWTAPAKFKIDPVTIGSTTSTIGMGYPYQRRVFVTGNGVIFALVYDGSNLDYIVSTDGGVTWNTVLIAACASCQAQDFAWWWDGSFVYLVDGPNNSANSICSSLPTGYFCYKVGTVSGSTIAWDSLQNVSSGANQVSSALIPSIITDSTGHIWTSFGSGQVASCTCSGQQAWVNASGFPQRPMSGSGVDASLVPLTSGKVALLFDATSGFPLQIQVWTGSSWTSQIATVSAVDSADAYSAVAVGDNVEAVFDKQTSRDVVGIYYRYAPNAWDSETTIDARTGITGREFAVLTYENALQQFYAFWNHGLDPESMYYATAPPGGSWSSPLIWTTDSGNPPAAPEQFATSYTVAATAIFLVGRDTAPVFWVGGPSSPYNIRYQSFLINVVPPSPPPVATGFPPIFTFNTTSFRIPFLGNVTLPTQLVGQPALLLLPVFPLLLLLSSEGVLPPLSQLTPSGRRKARLQRQTSLI